MALPYLANKELTTAKKLARLPLHNILNSLQKELKVNNETKNFFEQIVEKYKDDKYFCTAARLVRLGAHQHLDIVKQFSELDVYKKLNKSKTEVLSNLPLLVYSKNPDNLVVFPHIRINTSENIKHVSYLTYPSVLKPTLDIIEQEKNSAKTKIVWATSSGFKKLKKKEETTIGRVLRRFIPNFDKLDDVTIRTLAENISSERKPMELVEVHTPEDFIAMYTNGPSSCMTFKPGVTRKWDKMVKELKIHPCSFYAYHPNFRGIYAKKGNKVLARSIIQKQEDGWKAARIYSDTPEIGKKFLSNLNSQFGIEKATKYYKTKSETIEIPAYKLEGEEIMPFPSIDNVETNFYLEYDEDNAKFLLTMGDKLPQPANLAIGTTGYVSAKKYKFRICKVCSKRFNKDYLASQYSTIETDIFYKEQICGNNCLNKLNKVIITSSKNTQIKDITPDQIGIKGTVVCFENLRKANKNDYYRYFVFDKYNTLKLSDKVINMGMTSSDSRYGMFNGEKIIITKGAMEYMKKFNYVINDNNEVFEPETENTNAWNVVSN